MKMLTTEQHQTIFTKPESNQGRKSHNGCTSQLHTKDEGKHKGEI